MELTALYKQV